MAITVGEILAGKYRIEKLLGEGGMGAVYLATNQVLQKRVALKVMNARFAAVPAAVERFLREAVAASRVSHTSIVQVFDAGQHENMPWIAMELLEGETLGQRLERGPLSIQETLQMAEGVLTGLAEVHDEGIIHRDLKPDNIFLARTKSGPWVPKVLDFGVAKDTAEGKLNKLTATGAVVGTAYYLSPEQAKGLADIDARTDVYAMGVVLFECLSGEMPYQADTITQLIAKMFTETPRGLLEVAPELPQALADVVSACLDLDRNRRFQTARALLGGLRASAEAMQQGNFPQSPRAMGMAATAYAMTGVGQATRNGHMPGAQAHTPHPHTPHPHNPYSNTPHPHNQYSNTPHPSGAPQHYAPPSDPGFVAPAPSQGGFAHASSPGSSGPGVHAQQHYAQVPLTGMSNTPMPQQHGGMMATSVLPQSMMQSSPMMGSAPMMAPVQVEPRGGSRVGLIALVVLLFFLGAGGTGGAVWVFTNQNNEAPVARAEQPMTNHAVPDHARSAPMPAEPTTPTDTVAPVNTAPPPEQAPAEQAPVVHEQVAPQEANVQNTPRANDRDRRPRERPEDEPDPPAAQPVAQINTPAPQQLPPPQQRPVIPAPNRPAPPRSGLTQQQILTTIQQRLPFLTERCHDRVVRREPHVQGIVTISWTVGANGRVEAADIVHNGTGNDYLARCTRNVVRDTRFPAAPNGQTTAARYPFTFRLR